MKILIGKIGKTRAAAIWNAAEGVLYAFVFLWAVSFLVLGAHNPFIYFNF